MMGEVRLVQMRLMSDQDGIASVTLPELAENPETHR
jgi:hypothetical protein